MVDRGKVAWVGVVEGRVDGVELVGTSVCGWIEMRD